MVDDSLPPCEPMPEPTFLSIMLLWGAALIINSGCIGLVCITGWRFCRTRFARGGGGGGDGGDDGDGGGTVRSPFWDEWGEAEEWAGRRISLGRGGRAWWQLPPREEEEEEVVEEEEEEETDNQEGVQTRRTEQDAPEDQGDRLEDDGEEQDGEAAGRYEFRRRGADGAAVAADEEGGVELQTGTDRSVTLSGDTNNT